MEFKNGSFKLILFLSLVGVLILMIAWKMFFETDPSKSENLEALTTTSIEPVGHVSIRPNIQTQSFEGAFGKGSESNTPSEEEKDFQKELDHDREEQKQTKFLKAKLEQTDLELEQEKAQAEIDKLRKEDKGNYKELAIDGQKNIPDVIVEYIGGNDVKKEAILSIAGSNYKVKERSSPLDNIQVISISDSSVTLHFSAPQELTKTIDYKPE